VKKIFFNILLIVTFCLIIVLTNACTKVERYYYPDGKLSSEISKKHGVPNGCSRFYFHNGISVKMESNYKEGKLDGYTTRWYFNGYKEAEEYYVDALLEGKRRLWDEAGQLIVEDEYSGGVLNGYSRKWYPNGQLQIDAYYVNGKADGDWKYYDGNGIEVGYAHFNMGNGEQMILDKDGKVQKIIKFQDGVEVNYQGISE
jgi:antitoxin component YwqK of YwqJK toxin-antitoxin module